MMHRCDNGESECRSSLEDHGHNGARFPCDANAMVFSARWPEKIEEERCTKDEGGEDAGENVVAGRADVVIVVDVRPVVETLDELLLVNVVCGSCQ